jgi:methionine sulfoxide reductase heme-binding subunit
MNSILANKWTKVVVFLACLGPLGLIVWEGFHGDWGANPTQFLEHATGDWILRFIAITLAITPLRKILGLPNLIRFRRMLGLFAFFYGCIHFSLYVGLDQMLDLHGVWADVMKRRYITVGFTGFVLMIPLAVTSTAGMIRRLGGRRWSMLHRLIYLTAIAGVIHFYWLVKSDVHVPLEYAGIMAILLGWRLYVWYSGPGRHAPVKAVTPKQSTTPAVD